MYKIQLIHLLIFEYFFLVTLSITLHYKLYNASGSFTLNFKFSEDKRQFVKICGAPIENSDAVMENV